MVNKYNEILKNKCDKVVINGWDKLIECFNEQCKKEWIFRGENKKYDQLETSLERAFRLKISNDDSINEFEKKLINEFKRSCNLYIKDIKYIPDEENTVEWLALMQHHGAPTRLLDWSYSFFIAIFFALERPESKEKISKNNNYSYVWAIDSEWLRKKLKHSWTNTEKNNIHTKKREKIYKKYIFNDEPKTAVYLINPYELNERLVIQQGVFLCPGDLSKDFMGNLKGNFYDIEDNLEAKIKLYKIDLSKRKDILKKLYRMNINRATLFPGLDGFAESLRTLPLYKS